MPSGTYQVRVIGLSAFGQYLGQFSHAVTLTLEPGGPAPPPRVTVTAPVADSLLVRGTVVTFAWTTLPGAAQYGFEFTGPGLAFANPNGAAPDPVNGFGGAGGGFPVPGTALTVLLPPTLPPGTYQIRVIGLDGAGQLLGTFSDAVTVAIQ